MNTPPPPDIIFPPPESPASKHIRKATTNVESPTPSKRPYDDNHVDSPTTSRDPQTADSNGRVGAGVELQTLTRRSPCISSCSGTVLESEAYLFSARESWILRYILTLNYEAMYLLIRLLLRRPRKVHPLASITAAYSGEIGKEGVKRAAKTLCSALDFPEELAVEEPATIVSASSRLIDFWGPGETTRVNTVEHDRQTASNTPWSGLSTGLSDAEEKADPDLAEAIRRSLWEEEHGIYCISVDEFASSSARKRSGSEPIGIQDGSASRKNGYDSPQNKSGDDRTIADSSDNPAGSTVFTQVFAPEVHREVVTVLARDETELTLDDVMSCVSADDLRRVARARKVPPQMLLTRESTMKALRNVAHKQTTLSFAPVDKKGKGKGTDRRLAAQSSLTSERLVLSQLLPCLGDHVIQIDPVLCALIARVNLIFSRTPPTSAYAPSLLLPPILVSSHRRRYPDYGQPCRSVIWSTRDELLEWEHAVHYEALVSEVLGDNWAEQRRGGGPVQTIWRGQPLSRVEGAKIVRRVWENVWPVWQQLVAGDGGKPIEPAQLRGVAGDRFKTGHILTRIIAKGADALGVLHEYDLECEVLRALLGQRRWRRGKRGAWYDRFALVLMTHYKDSEAQKVSKLEQATQGSKELTAVYRPRLSHRLTRLENRLNLPADERHISFAELLKCETRELVAIRSRQNIGQPFQAAPSRMAQKGDDNDEEGNGFLPQVGKSAWIGRESEVTVEGWVLEWWEDRGYEGYHAESSIVTTLFALLMWPVLFHPVQGAFETLYQTAPLDLGEDTFARARQTIIEEHLAAMESTETALEMLRTADLRERPKETWVAGLSWDFGRRELEEILTCLGGHAVALICRMLCEEYRHRASGVPDLIVWNYDKREARFVEVKGPGDTLSETQKIWIDVLLSAGILVEVCRVKAKEGSGDESASKPKPKRGNSGNSGRRLPKRIPSPILVDDSDEAEEGENGEDDEWQYESGQEGKAEGRWARPGVSKRRKY